MFYYYFIPDFELSVVVTKQKQRLTQVNRINYLNSNFEASFRGGLNFITRSYTRYVAALTLAYANSISLLTEFSNLTALLHRDQLCHIGRRFVRLETARVVLIILISFPLVRL